MKADARFISVSADGEASVAPDLAVVSFAVSGTGEALAATRDDVNARSSSVLAKVRELGVKDADLTAPDIGIHPEYDYRKGQRLVGYRVERQMTVKVRDLDRLGDVLDGIVGTGANEVHGARMSASDPSAAEHDALRAAIAAAHAKAEVLAEAAGVTLGAAMRIREESSADASPYPVARAMAMAESADVRTEVASGDVPVTRRIRAWFAIT